MRALLLDTLGPMQAESRPLRMADLPIPVPKEREVLIRIAACGVCHTELDEIEGRTAPSRLPMVLGHQVVGFVESIGNLVTDCVVGERVGVAWVFSACGTCTQCLHGRENLSTLHPLGCL